MDISRLSDRLINVMLCCLMLAFFYVHISLFIEEWRLSLLLISIFELIVGVFFLIRRSATSIMRDWRAWSAAIIATFGVFLVRPVVGIEDLIAGQVLQVFGLVLQIAALLSLNRSLGIVPANRGIKTGGLYRWVRHPLYTSYLFSHAGYLLSNPSWYNVLILAGSYAFQFARIHFEEKELSQDPEYRQYKENTHYRLLPYVW